MTGRETLDAAVTEDEFLSAVVELAQWKGWLVHHSRPARMKDGRWRTPVQGDNGFPDLVLARSTPRLGGNIVILSELKAQRGRLSAAQEEWLTALDWDGPDGQWEQTWSPLVFVWRPSDWALITEVLA